MSEIEMIKVCADAMQITLRCGGCGWPIRDSEDKGCVIGNCSMRPMPTPHLVNTPTLSDGTPYNPINDDAQAMALVKKFNLWIAGPEAELKTWTVTDQKSAISSVGNENLNRAIVECVANMQDVTAPPQ